MKCFNTGSRVLISAADIGIVIDSSGDLGSTHWFKTLDFLKILITNLKIEQYGHGLGLLTHGSIPFLFQPLSTQSVQSTVAQIDSWKNYEGPLSYMKTVLFWSSQNRPMYGIYVTDSFTRQNETKLRRGAEQLKANDIQLYIIVIGASLGYLYDLIEDNTHLISVEDITQIDAPSTVAKLKELSAEISGETGEHDLLFGYSLVRQPGICNLAKIVVADFVKKDGAESESA